MLNAEDLVSAIKQASMEAVSNSKPADLCVGNVLSSNPLKIQIDQKITLTRELVVVPQSLTDYEVDAEVDTIKKKIKIFNSLKAGDKVMLLRASGGQLFFILDKVVGK